MENLKDVALERAVLACVCNHGSDAYTDVADILTSKSFTDATNQNIWGVLSHIMSDNPKAKVDFPTFMSTANALGLSSYFAKDDDIKLLRATFNLPVKLENARRLAKRIGKLEFAREALNVVDDVRKEISSITGEESVESILSKIQGPILDIESAFGASGAGPQKVGKGLREYAEYLAKNQRDVVGISSGFKVHDFSIGGGYRPGTINVVGARPKIGKSLLATNIGISVAGGCGYNFPNVNLDMSIPVLQLDTEMTREDQWNRQLACLSGIRIDDIEKGHYFNEIYKRNQVNKAIDIFEKIPYDFLSIAGQPFEETEAVMRRWVTRNVGLNDDGTAKPCLIIFDYLKLMDSSAMQSSNLAEFQVLGFMMTRLHNFAVRYKIPILTFIQLNRDGINVEDTNAASGSDRIIWLCSNFSIYKKKSDEEMAEQVGRKNVYNRKMVPIVARHGGGLDDGEYINMMSHGPIARIVEGATSKNAYRENQQEKGIILNGQTDEVVPFSA